VKTIKFTQVINVHTEFSITQIFEKQIEYKRIIK